MLPLQSMAEDLSSGLEVRRQHAASPNSMLSLTWQPTAWETELQEAVRAAFSRTPDVSLGSVASGVRSALQEMKTVIRTHNREVARHVHAHTGTLVAINWQHVHLAALEESITRYIAQASVAVALVEGLRRSPYSMTEVARLIGRSAAYLSGLRHGRGAILSDAVAIDLDRYLFANPTEGPFTKALSVYRDETAEINGERTALIASLPERQDDPLSLFPPTGRSALLAAWQRDPETVLACLNLLESNEMSELILRLSRAPERVRRAVLQLLKAVNPQ